MNEAEVTAEDVEAFLTTTRPRVRSRRLSALARLLCRTIPARVAAEAESAVGDASDVGGPSEAA